MERRHFLKLFGTALVYSVCPWTWAAKNTDLKSTNRILILLELKGGNDGLNTIVPYTNSTYYRLRPKLAIQRDQVLQISETLGFNPSLKALMDLWQQKELAIVTGIGYPDPNRSHFRSIEIWETGSSSNDYLQNGWLARALEEKSSFSEAVADGAAIGGDVGPLAGGKLNVVVIRNINKYLRQAQRVDEIKMTTDNPALKHLLSVHNDLHRSGRALNRILKSRKPLGIEFPQTPIGRNLEITARLISADTRIPVIKVSHGGFDTHANQRFNHDRLLQQLAEAMTAFNLAMVDAGWWDRVLVMTYSEFGRRPAENGSRGTDHGTAAPHFILGGRVKGGIYGSQPSLTSLENGDLKFNVDYRRLYATIARNWWGLNDKFLKGGPFKGIDCL